MSRTFAHALTLVASFALLGVVAGCETPVPKADPALNIDKPAPKQDEGGGGNVDPVGGGESDPAGAGTGS